MAVNLLKPHTSESWKTREFVEIPQEVKDNMKTIEVSERHVDVQFDGQIFDIFTRRSAPHKVLAESFHVLLLHGASFTSMNWLELDTLSLIAALGHTAVAIDIPGFGNSHGDISNNNAAEFLAKFIDQENLDCPVIVSPSMSGSYSIPFLMSEPCEKRARGFIPIAPVQTNMFTHSQYQQCQVPTMIVYGQNDRNIGRTSLSNLRHLHNKEICEIADAGHACYMNKPEEWRRLLYNFLKAI